MQLHRNGKETRKGGPLSYNNRVDMAWFDGSLDEERLKRCEDKATEIRKLLFGALMLAKDRWKTALEQEPEGREVLRALSNAEADFVTSGLSDRTERIEDLLDVILKRAKALFLLMEHVSKERK